MDTTKLEIFANDLKNLFGKHSDSYFVSNLIAEIKKGDRISFEVIKNWLLAAFDFPKNYDDYNCIDTYNKSFYNSIIEKI